MVEFPRTRIDGLSVSRLVIGSNWFLGYSHTSRAQDRMIREDVTEARVTDIVSVFLEAGVDATIGLSAHPKLLNAIRRAEDRVGRKVTIISTPAFPLDDEDGIARLLDEEQARGVDVCMPHQSTTDQLVDRRTRTIHDGPRFMRMIRDRGMVPGLSTHMPESILYADEMELDCATYVQIYNAVGFLMPIEVDWVYKIIHEAKKPVLTIKPLAAGRLMPLPGLAFSWATIRQQDMVAVGTMTPDEAREVIELSQAILEGRQANIVLQETRSKMSVKRAAAAAAPTPETEAAHQQ